MAGSGGLHRLECLLDAADGAALRRGQPEPAHGVGEFLPVLRQPDGALVGPDQLDAVLRDGTLAKYASS